MAIVARFSFDVPFGRKDELFATFKKFETLRAEIGFPKMRFLVGSIGTPESRVEQEFVVDNLAQLEATWAKIGSHPGTPAFRKAMGELIVPGSHRWEILRIQEL